MQRLGVVAAAASLQILLLPVSGLADYKRHNYSVEPPGDEVLVLSPPLPGLVAENGRDGMLVDVLREISLRTGFRFRVRVLPSPRVASQFINGKGDAAMPILDIEMPHYDVVKNLRTAPLVFRKDHAFVREGELIPTKVEDLDGRRIVAARGYGLDSAITERPGISIQEAKDDYSALMMVRRNRADIYISDEFVVTETMERNGIEGIVHDPNSPLFIYGAAILFHDTPEWRPIFREVDMAIREIWSEGRMREIIPFNLPGEAYRSYLRSLVN